METPAVPATDARLVGSEIGRNRNGADGLAGPAAATPATDPQRWEAARAFAVELARLAANTRCHNVTVMDVSGLSPVTDFFVLASGTSARQMRSVCDDVREAGEGRGFRALSQSGYEGENWILVDFVDVVVHLFSDEARQFYDLDNLWGDAKRVEWRQAEEMVKG